MGNFLHLFMVSQVLTELCMTSSALGDCTGGPFNVICIRAFRRSLLSLLLNLVFNLFKALAPHSGQALVTGPEIEISAKATNLGKKWPNSDFIRRSLCKVHSNGVFCMTEGSGMWDFHFNKSNVNMFHSENGSSVSCSLHPLS